MSRVLGLRNATDWERSEEDGEVRLKDGSGQVWHKLEMAQVVAATGIFTDRGVNCAQKEKDMAFKLPFKWPKKNRRVSPNKSELKAKDVKTIQIPWFSKQSFDRQLRVLGALLLLFLFIAAAFTYIDTRDTSYASRYVARSSKLLMLSQRLAKDAAASFSGDSAAFEELGDTRTEFSSILEALDKGSDKFPRHGRCCARTAE